MRKIIFLLAFLLLSLWGFAQKEAMSKTLKINYVTWHNGKYYIVLNNLQKCSTTVDVHWNGRDTIFLIGLIEVVRLPGRLTDMPIKARPLDFCSTTFPKDSSWLEIRAIEKQYVRY